jgi:hypothetical protein
MRHAASNALILHVALRISTPWVAGSNPAGIANAFSVSNVFNGFIVDLAHRVRR